MVTRNGGERNGSNAMNRTRHGCWRNGAGWVGPTKVENIPPPGAYSMSLGLKATAMLETTERCGLRPEMRLKSSFWRNAGLIYWLVEKSRCCGVVQIPFADGRERREADANWYGIVDQHHGSVDGNRGSSAVWGSSRGTMRTSLRRKKYWWSCKQNNQSNFY